MVTHWGKESNGPDTCLILCQSSAAKAVPYILSLNVYQYWKLECYIHYGGVLCRVELMIGILLFCCLLYLFSLQFPTLL